MSVKQKMLWLETCEGSPCTWVLCLNLGAHGCLSWCMWVGTTICNEQLWDVLSLPGPFAQKGSMLSLIFCSHLETQSFYLWSCIEVKSNGTMVQRRYTQSRHPAVLDALFTDGVHRASWARNSCAPTGHRTSTKLKPREAWSIYTWSSTSDDSPKRLSMCPNQTSHQTEETQWNSKNHEWPRSPIKSFLTVLILPNHLYWKL